MASINFNQGGGGRIAPPNTGGFDPFRLLDDIQRTVKGFRDRKAAKAFEEQYPNFNPATDPLPWEFAGNRQLTAKRDAILKGNEARQGLTSLQLQNEGQERVNRSRDLSNIEATQALMNPGAFGFGGGGVGGALGPGGSEQSPEQLDFLVNSFRKIGMNDEADALLKRHQAAIDERERFTGTDSEGNPLTPERMKELGISPPEVTAGGADSGSTLGGLLAGLLGAEGIDAAMLKSITAKDLGDELGITPYLNPVDVAQFNLQDFLKNPVTSQLGRFNFFPDVGGQAQPQPQPSPPPLGSRISPIPGETPPPVAQSNQQPTTLEELVSAQLQAQQQANAAGGPREVRSPGNFVPQPPQEPRPVVSPGNFVNQQPELPPGFRVEDLPPAIDEGSGVPLPNELLRLEQEADRTQDTRKMFNQVNQLPLSPEQQMFLQRLGLRYEPRR